MKSILFLLLFSGYLCNINAQSDFLVWETDLIKDRKNSITKIAAADEFDQFYLVLDKGDFKHLQWSYNDSSDWRSIDQNEHNSEVVISGLYFVTEGTKEIYLKNAETLAGRIYFQRIQPLEIQLKKAEMRSSDCTLPPVVTQEEWRAGLPDPVPGRTGSKVNHLIIHHSAGDNGRDNYVDVVRAYYLYHINGNGWDDIGYNYLIDPYGILYAGRDPLDSGIDQDNVVGAHLCAKNTNTMGVCMIGDFTDTLPSILARATLINLLSWKALKDTIQVFGTALHPVGTGAPLDRIAGHRDGCSTTCPGNSFYPALHEIKLEVQAKIENCLLSTGSEEEMVIKPEWKVSPNPFTGTVTISGRYLQSNVKYNLRDSHGHFIKGNDLPPFIAYEIDLTAYPPGIYYLQILNEKHATVKKIIKH